MKDFSIVLTNHWEWFNIQSKLIFLVVLLKINNKISQELMSGFFLTSNLVSFRILFGGFYFGIKEQMWFVFVTVYVLYCISHEMSDDMGSYIRAMNDEIKQLESKLNMLKTATHIPANLDALSMKQRYYLSIYIPPFFFYF